MMPTKILMKKLIEDKEAAENRRITYRDIRAETGINLNTVTALMNDDWSLIGRVTIDRLLEYFECEPNDLLIRETNATET